MDKKIKQFFATGNKNTSDNELLLAYYCASTAASAEEFEENLASVLANLSGVTKLDEEGGRDTVGRAYNFLAGLHHAQLKTNCLAVFARFGNDPTAVLENLDDLAKRIMLPKSKSRKPKQGSDEEEEPKEAKKQPKKASKKSDDESASDEPKKQSKKASKSDEESASDEPKKEEPKAKAKVPVVLPKKSGLPQPDF